MNESHAVRVMVAPPSGGANQFDSITFTPDGATIVTTGQFVPAAADRVYSLPVPANPLVDTSAVTQLSTDSFTVNSYDVDFVPVVSPDGQTILFTHSGSSSGQNSIYTMPITGEGMADFTGLFGADPNFASPGDGSSSPIYSADGSTIFFINNNAGFDGASIPIFTSSAFDSRPDWDRLYSVPAAGGTPTAITAPGDGDIDNGLFTLTPNGSTFIYAPDTPVAEDKDRGGNRPKLFSISTAGGASTEIPIPAPGHDFSFARQIQTTSDGLTLFFIADYENIGKHELFSVPVAGGTPTRISDDLPFAGDVSSFKIAPNGTSVAYIAGQNTSANSELFLTPLAGGTGNSIRVSEPAPSNSGEFDVSTTVGEGRILFSSDSSQIYYIGDLDVDGESDLYVVDTTEKTGLIPSPFTFIGASGGDFFDETNWEDVDGNNPAAGTIDPGASIRHSLIIDGDTVGSSGGEADFQVGGSLELTPGSVLNFPNSNDKLDFNIGSGLKLTDATIVVDDDIFLEGTNVLSGGRIESVGDDIEFQDGHDTFIDGTTLITGTSEEECTFKCGIWFENSASSITNATFDTSDRLGMRYEVDVTVDDTTIIVRGLTPTHPSGLGYGDVEDAFAGAQGEGSILTLKGASTLFANAIQDGVALVLDGTSVATLLSDPGGHADDPVGGFDLVDSNGTITFISTDAELVTLHASATDVRSLVINGLTGLSYLDDPTAWNVTNWDGTSPLASLQLLAVGIAGDFNNNGSVDAADYTLWLDNLGSSFDLNGNGNETGGSSGLVDQADYDLWKANFGNTVGTASSDLGTVPEPSALCLAMLFFAGTGAFSRRKF